jgi:hypothetical protein
MSLSRQVLQVSLRPFTFLSAGKINFAWHKEPVEISELGMDLSQFTPDGVT